MLLNQLLMRLSLLWMPKQHPHPTERLSAGSLNLVKRATLSLFSVHRGNITPKILTTTDIGETIL